jgi:hypothetical protein
MKRLVLILMLLAIPVSVLSTTYVVYQDSAQDQYGNAISGAVVTVTAPGGSTPLALSLSSTGTPTALSVTTAATGKFIFYVTPGAYDVWVTYKGQSDKKYNVLIGSVPATINGYEITSNPTLTSGDVGATPSTATINGLPISSNPTLTCGNIAGCGSGGSGAVTSITSANGDATITNPTTTPVITLNTGTGANQIVKLDGSGKLPAVDGSNLTALPVVNLATGTTGSLDISKTSGVQASLGYTAENIASKSTDTNLGSSDTLYPSQKATKGYVDAHSSGSMTYPSGSGLAVVSGGTSWGTTLNPASFVTVTTGTETLFPISVNGTVGWYSDWSMNLTIGHNIWSADTPTSSSSIYQIANKDYVDTSDALRALATGGTLTNPTLVGTKVISDVTGTTQCLHVNSSGVISGTGADCGSGGGSGANANGYYLVTNSTNAPTNGVNLGALSTGLLKITISGGVATPSTASAGSDYQAALTYPVTGVASPTTNYLTKWSGTNTLADGLKIGTFTDTKWCSYTTASGFECTQTAPLATNGSAASLTSFPTFNQSTTGTAAKATILETTRAIYGNNFDGSVALTQVVASLYGGTGNAYTMFTGPTTTTRTFTLPDAAATILYSGGALGTPSSGSAANLTSFPTLNQNTSGTAAGLSGTPALPNGTTATTQAAGSNDTKVATDAYIDATLPVVDSANGGTITARNGYHITTGATTWTLPATTVGYQHCFRQASGGTNAISVTPPTSSYVEAANGSAYCTISHAIKSGGANGDSICFVAIDTTHWMVWGGAAGTWTCQ